MLSKPRVFGPKGDQESRVEGVGGGQVIRSRSRVAGVGFRV